MLGCSFKTPKNITFGTLDSLLTFYIPFIKKHNTQIKKVIPVVKHGGDNLSGICANYRLKVVLYSSKSVNPTVVKDFMEAK